MRPHYPRQPLKRDKDEGRIPQQGFQREIELALVQGLKDRMKGLELARAPDLARKRGGVIGTCNAD